MINGKTKVSVAVGLVSDIGIFHGLNVQGNIKDLQKAVRIYNSKLN